MIISCIFTQIFIAPKLFKTKHTITGSGMTLELSLDELYQVSDKFVRCTPVEILPAQWTAFGDENASMTIITTDIVMKIIDNISSSDKQEDIFILRIAGGYMKEENIEMIDEENLLGNIHIGTEYLMFLTPEQIPANPKETKYISIINDKTLYRTLMNGADGIFIKQEPKEGNNEYWISLSEKLKINKDNFINMDYK